MLNSMIYAGSFDIREQIMGVIIDITYWNFPNRISQNYSEHRLYSLAGWEIFGVLSNVLPSSDYPYHNE